MKEIRFHNSVSFWGLSFDENINLTYNFLTVSFVSYLVLNNYFWEDIGFSQLTSYNFILSHEALFYKPTVPQNSPSDLQYYSTWNCPTSSEFPTVLSKWMVHAFIQMNGAYKNLRIQTLDLSVMNKTMSTRLCNTFLTS